VGAGQRPPAANAIVWQDRRTAEACARLKAEGAEGLVREKTGLVLDPYFSATKLAWLLDHLPGARAGAQRGELAAGTVDSWLAWNLSGGRLHITDPSNASRTSLFNIHSGDWDADLLALFGIPRELLPRVVRSSALCGETAPALFGAPIRLGGMAGDQQAALFGQACHGAGMAKNTYGTGCFLLMHTGGRPSPRPTADRHLRGADGRCARIRPGGQRLHRRRGGAVAARRPRPDPPGGRHRGAGRRRAGCRRRGLRAGLRRSRRAALEPHARGTCSA
jgi:sugar (pentulose or hexulose) kinase